MTKKERETKKIKQQLNITDKKSIEERGFRKRSCIFEDKKKKQLSKMCDSAVVKKEISEY